MRTVRCSDRLLGGGCLSIGGSAVGGVLQGESAGGCDHLHDLWGRHYPMNKWLTDRLQTLPCNSNYVTDGENLNNKITVSIQVNKINQSMSQWHSNQSHRWRRKLYVLEIFRSRVPISTCINRLLASSWGTKVLFISSTILLINELLM